MKKKKDLKTVFLTQKIKKLNNLEFIFSLIFIVIGLVNLAVLNSEIQNDKLFQIIALVSSSLIIIIGLIIQEFIEGKIKLLKQQLSDTPQGEIEHHDIDH